MNEILLEPTDVLFFRDGRPMEGSLAGHTAAWPLPDITNHALHAALHRAEIEGVHSHRRGRSGDYSKEDNHRDQKFGSLQTAGPFPVQINGDLKSWFFPRPADAQVNGSPAVSLLPVSEKGSENQWQSSSLPGPLKYAVGNSCPPSKDLVEPWWSECIWNEYLGTTQQHKTASTLQFGRNVDFKTDEDFTDREQQVGIAIDPATGTTGQGQAEGMIYSAHYLRLKPNIRLGLYASAMDKMDGNPGNKREMCDLIETMLNGQPTSIIVGGQQRICTARRNKAPNRLPLPLGMTDASKFHKLTNGKFAVKWILISPAIFPEITTSDKNPTAHPGGWLPTWIRESDGQVMLKNSTDSERQTGEGRKAWRRRVASLDPISAKLVASIIPKPIPVTGWALPDPKADEQHRNGGAKSTHLAVSAGAVYYFEAETAEAAQSLATALNWHGTSPGAAIQNRRSSLMGEKGFGLGVCATWKFHPAGKAA